VKPLLIVIALLGWTVPALAQAEPQAPVTKDSQNGFAADQSLNRVAAMSDGALTGKYDRVQLAARVIRGRRGGAVLVGPRGGVVVDPCGRTGVFRGRTVNAFRARPFVYPRGFADRRWRPGLLLPAAFIAAPFFYLEYERLGLSAPPPGLSLGSPWA
jgi:hypothetical protein